MGTGRDIPKSNSSENVVGAIINAYNKMNYLEKKQIDTNIANFCIRLIRNTTDIASTKTEQEHKLHLKSIGAESKDQVCRVRKGIKDIKDQNRTDLLYAKRLCTLILESRKNTFAYKISSFFYKFFNISRRENPMFIPQKIASFVNIVDDIDQVLRIKTQRTVDNSIQPINFQTDQSADLRFEQWLTTAKIFEQQIPAVLK